jgi:tRNA threonylcarbamoyl adenosine modification protein YeaZ
MILAIDTASTLCAACVLDAGVERGRAVRDLGKGHAEHLMAVIEEALAQAGVTYADLSRIAVSIGPGSFTGVRVGVSTARGLAMALRIPAVGVTTLEAIAAEARDTLGTRPVLAALDAGRGEIHAGLYDATGGSLLDPAVMTLEQAVSIVRQHTPVLCGSAARLIAAELGTTRDIGPVSTTADIAVYARLGAEKSPAAGKPKPLYLREADAKPQAGFVLPREAAR